MAFIFANPTLVDLVERHRIEVMQFFPSTPNNDDQSCLFQERKMLRHSLPGHVVTLAEFAQCLSVVLMQGIEQLSPAGVRERLKNYIHRFNMQLKGCMSSAASRISPIGPIRPIGPILSEALSKNDRPARRNTKSKLDHDKERRTSNNRLPN
jgi:hypothetical protein